MTITRLLARPLLASIFVVGGVNALRNSEAHAAKAKPVTDRVVPLAQQAVPQAPIPTDPARRWCGSTPARSSWPPPRSPPVGRPASARPSSPRRWCRRPSPGTRFWEETDPQAKATQRLQFAKNTSILGGLLLAGVDTEGRPGLAWRARRAAADVRREAKQVAKDARREAKLARAQT